MGHLHGIIHDVITHQDPIMKGNKCQMMLEGTFFIQMMRSLCLTSLASNMELRTKNWCVLQNFFWKIRFYQAYQIACHITVHQSTKRSKFAQSRSLSDWVQYKARMQYMRHCCFFKQHEWWTCLRAHHCVALHRASKMQWLHVDSPIAGGVPSSAPKA